MPTVKQLHKEIQAYNKRNCVRGYSKKNKKALLGIVSKMKPVSKPKPSSGNGGGTGSGKKKKRITPVLVSSGGMGSSVGGSSGGTKGQKTTKKKLHQLSSMYGSLVEDANPELAF
jgi:hypothetical protein